MVVREEAGFRLRLKVFFFEESFHKNDSYLNCSGRSFFFLNNENSHHGNREEFEIEEDTKFCIVYFLGTYRVSSNLSTSLPPIYVPINIYMFL